MKNCLILGCGRSGTSMTAGMLAPAGYFMGRDLITGRPSNPKGFFEDRNINNINEALLRAVSPNRPPILQWWVLRDRPRQGQRWLARVPVGTPLRCKPKLAAQIRELVSHQPYCFKDPRFCYTLPAWRPLLPPTVFVCVFREPAQTIGSILRECSSMPYLRDLRLDHQAAGEVWRLMYQHVLMTHRNEGGWLFLHARQLLTAEGRRRLGEFVDASVDHNFADNSAMQWSAGMCPRDLQETYRQLCELAGYDPPRTNA